MIGVKLPLLSGVVLVMASTLTGCQGDATPENETAPAETVIQPADFALRTCDSDMVAGPCLIIQAGGKALIFGAPEGAMAALEAAGIDSPDGVFLTALTPDSLEGLARIRNQSWQQGRTAPLPVTGPDGFAEVAAHLDAAFEPADAIIHLQQRPPGGFDAAPLAPIEIAPGRVVRVFDTGDLIVEAGAALQGDLSYLVIYDTHHLVIEPCAPRQREVTGNDVDLRLVCEASGETYSWPFETDIHILNRPAG